MLQRSWAFEGERQRNSLDTSMGARRVPTPLVGHYLFGMWEEKKLFPIVMEPGQVVFTNGKEMKGIFRGELEDIREDLGN